MGIKPYFFSDSFLDFPTHFWIIIFYWILERVQYKTPKIIALYSMKNGHIAQVKKSIKSLND